MSRFHYKHFGSDVPREIEATYNQMLRQEQYIEEKEKWNVIREFSIDDILEQYPDPETLTEVIQEKEQKSLFLKRLSILPIALKKLEFEFPDEYALIIDYYFSRKEITQSYLCIKYKLTIDSIRYHLSHAKEKLKEYIFFYENEY